MLGIAAGVALLFASQVASQSLSSSVAQLSERDRRKRASLQLTRARSARASRKPAGARPPVPGSASRAAAGSERERGRADAAARRCELDRRRLEPRALGGSLAAPAPNSETVRRHRRGRCCQRPGRTRSASPVRPGSRRSQLYGARSSTPALSALARTAIGGLARQPDRRSRRCSTRRKLTGLPGRVIAHPRAGAARRRSSRCARPRSARGGPPERRVRPSYDERLFAKAAAPANQSSALFAVISALVGFLFAFNAMLLTVPQRRRLIAGLRRDGYTRRTRASALLLWTRSCSGSRPALLGLVLGEELSIHLFRSNPGYLGVRVLGRHPARRRPGRASRSPSARRHARRDRRRAEPAARHHLPRPARGDHAEGGRRGRPARTSGPRSRVCCACSAAHARSCSPRPSSRSSGWSC